MHKENTRKKERKEKNEREKKKENLCVCMPVIGI